MSLSFFEHGVHRLEAIVKPGMLCAFDFDGTLAPIVKEPERACMPAAVRRRLMLLSDYARVAIITGRAVDDVGLRLDFLPDFVVGNHGIEGMPGWEHEAERYRQLCVQWEQSLAAAFADHALFDPCVWIENKTYSLSVHYRLARDREKVEAQLQQLFAMRLPAARVVAGKCVFNLLPADAPDKGMALDKLCAMSGAASALYVGDDVTDEAVFLMRREDWLTIRIERSEDSAAEYYLHHRLDIIQLLDKLIEKLSGARPMHAEKSASNF